MASETIVTKPKGDTNLQQMCRLCLSDESLDSIFKESLLHQWISEYLAIVVSPEDCLSQTICATCRLRLTDFHQFWIRCQEVQNELQSMTKVQDVEVENVSIPYGQAMEHQIGHRNNNERLHCETSFELRQQLNDHMKWHTTGHFELEKVTELAEKELATEHEPNGLKVEPYEEVDYMNGEQTDELEPIPRAEPSRSIEGTNADEFQETFVKEESIPVNSSYDIEHDHKEEDHARTDEEFDDNQSIGTDDMITIEEVKIESSPNQVEEANNTTVRQSYPCSKCNKVYYSKQGHWFHYHSKHGLRKHVCHTCGIGFVQLRGLNRHYLSKKHLYYLKREALANKTKKGNERKMLAPHIKVHRREEARAARNATEPNIIAEQFKCDICERLFSSKKALHHHKIKVHGSKSSECDICGYKFTYRCSLKRHMQAHDDNGDRREDFLHLHQMQQTGTSKHLND